MNNTIPRTESAYDYQLLIKQLFEAPIIRNSEQMIHYSDQLSITYSLWKNRVHRLAGALTALGVKKGSTVAVLDWDSHRYLEAYYAIPMIGAVLHTINIRLPQEQLLYTIEHAEDDVIICNASFLPLLEVHKGRIIANRKFVLINENFDEVKSPIPFEGEYEELLNEAPDHFEFPDFDENTRATTFYTTGTTGLPKAVYFSHRQLVLHTMTALASFATPQSQGRIHRDSVYMPITPMFHVHAWGFPYVATFMGIEQVYPGQYIPSKLVSLLGKYKVTFSHCVPTILNLLLNDPGIDNVDLSNWTCIIGGSALTTAMTKQAYDRGIDIFAGYGMSETCPILSVAHLSAEELEYSEEEQIALRCRTGKPLGLVHCKIIDGNGKQVPLDDKTAGEIVVRAPYLTQGYLKDRVHSENLWEGGWLHTNDVACMSENGSLRITDRTKDVIKVGGEWLSSLEIEDVISRHPGILEVAVVAKADEKWGEIPLIIVVNRENEVFEDRELTSAIRNSIDSGILPREALTHKIIRIDSLDKTSVGKVNKLALRDKYC